MEYKQRLIGFSVCLGIGFILTFGSVFRILRLVAGDPLPFVVNYTLGNVIALCASCFLFGPWSQAKKMCEKSRAAATSIYLLTLIITIVVASVDVIPLRGPILIVLVIVQFLAMLWYSLSYIPYAREMLSNICSKCNGDNV